MAASVVAKEVAAVAPGAMTATAAPTAARKLASDDEILGIASRHVRRAGDGAESLDVDQRGSEESRDGAERREASGDWSAAVEENPELRGMIEATPAVKDALDDVSAYRETFATPEAARQASGLAADLNRLDALFYSRRPEDHAELARAVAALDQDAFSSLASAMAELAGAAKPGTSAKVSAGPSAADSDLAEASERANSSKTNARTQGAGRTTGDGKLSAAQAEFFQAANASAVEGVVGAIESQVEKLLPEGISKTARNRVVGEIYRELDTVLRGNRVLTQQIQDAFRTGRLDADHQKAVVSLITARARQALPAVAKRVLNEWTNTIVTMNEERRTRQRNAERRVDIAGSGGGNDGRRATTSKDIDYRRMSDADILNL